MEVMFFSTAVIWSDPVAGCAHQDLSLKANKCGHVASSHDRGWGASSRHSKKAYVVSLAQKASDNYDHESRREGLFEQLSIKISGSQSGKHNTELKKYLPRSHSQNNEAFCF